MNNEVSFLSKVLIALCAGVFGVAIAICLQHIKIFSVSKWLILLSVAVQFVLSLGLFLGTMLVFASALLPQSVPNDDYSALSVAYFISTIPHIIITTLLIIYDKEINAFLKKRYNDESKENALFFTPLHEQNVENEEAKMKGQRLANEDEKAKESPPASENKGAKDEQKALKTKKDV
ncbi:hypothetical protein GW575_00025 [Campylobacter sp. MIT 19-121]|uniref:hypothetical protein n=1 Tax=Campylobacter sp. MIT 19-121 TaxID=2703906 RepID=UPI00138A0A6B|nr:hypothetical protein [Campylobacter sp. MIT 19-121]NDJ26343.1 hypothetical protein [Campylobacter sp. MIT 19-121]